MENKEFVEKIIKLVNLVIDKKIKIKVEQYGSFFILNDDGKKDLEFRYYTRGYSNKKDEHYLNLCDPADNGYGGVLFEVMLNDEDNIQVKYNLLRLKQFLKNEAINKLNNILK